MKKTFLFTLCLLYPALSLADPQQVTLSLPTMNCIACPITVKKALKKVEGVISADVSFETKLAIVTYEDSVTSIDSLIAATTNAGYPSTSESSNRNE